MAKNLIFCVFLFTIAPWMNISGQEQEFVDVVKGLLQGDELQKLQSIYSALPLELRDKLSKDLLSNPAKVGKDIMNLVGPHFQTLLNGFTGKVKRDMESNVVDSDYPSKFEKQSPPGAGGGIEFGPLATMLGNLVSNNPQMLVTMAQSYLESSGANFNFESITTMITEKFDLDTVMNMASSFGLGLPSADRSRGENDGPSKSILEMLKLNEIVKMWQDFAKSPFGQKVNRVVPRLLKSESLPEALRLLERETSFKFDLVLLQLQDPHIRKVLVSQTVKPIGKFFKGITIPKDFKVVLTQADGIFNKLGLGVKAKDFIEPTFNYIRDTFKITRESLLDLKPEDIEKIATEVITNEILEPLSNVYNIYQKAVKNSQCAQFIFCQVNHDFYHENFIKRNVIKSASIISAFQLTSVIKNKDFSPLYEAAYKGASGYDCTMGTSSFCLDLMSTTAHNEL